MLKNADRRSTLLKILDPWIFEVKSLNNGRGWASVTVFLLSALKSEQGLTPPPGFGARWRAELQSVFMPGLILSMTPSFSICSQAFLPASFFSGLALMGLRFALQGGWSAVSMRCQTLWTGTPALKDGSKS